MRAWGWMGGLALALACAGGEPDPVVMGESPSLLAAWSGGRLEESALRAQIEQELRVMEVRQKLERYELWSRALDAAIEAALLEEARREAGLATVDELVAREVERRLTDPPEDEVLLELERMEAQMPGRSREELRATLVPVLRENQREQARAAWLEELKAARGLQVFLPYPDLPRATLDVAPHNPALGPADAPVTLVQFVDFQCYYCRRAAPMLERLMRERPDDVRVVYKDFPLQGHPVARRAARHQIGRAHV